MRAKTLIQALTLLLVLSPLLACHHTAYASTTVTVGPDRCTVTVTINIEIYGPAANQALADRWKRNIESTWNGPTGELAQRVAEMNGLDVNANRAEVDRLAREFLRQAGVNCSYVNCCNICFVANVRLRQGDTPTPNTHQIEALPYDMRPEVTGAGTTTGGRAVRVNGYVVTPGTTGASTTGKWVDDTTRPGSADNPWPVEAHETGHLMGLGDQYGSQVGADGSRTSTANAGHEHDIMANNLSFPFEDAVNEILRLHGVECNCCEDPSSLYQRYGIAWHPATDSILTCNLEVLRAALHDLEGQRRDLGLTRVSAADRYDLGKKLDDLIARIRRAIEDCERRVPPPTETGMIPGGTPGSGPGVTCDGSQWCTYWPWDPVTVPPPTEEVPPTVPPPTEPPTVPPTVPPTEVPPTVPPTVPPVETPPTVPPPTVPPPTVPPTVERPPTKPPEEKPPTVPPTVPPSIIKATVTDPHTGQPVTGCRLALTSPPPDLPGTRARDDSGFNEDSTQGTTGADGTCRLVPGGSTSELIKQLDGGGVKEAEMEIDLPSFKSYIAKIKIDKTKAAWDNPSSYLDPAVSYFVARKWIVGDSMYVVINVPTIQGEQK